MVIKRYRHLIAPHYGWWCFAGLLLSALQPFLFIHFQQDGWENEPGFRVRNVEAMALFSPDDRDDHKTELETTLYVPAAARIEAPDALQHGLDGLKALVFLLVPLTVALHQVPAPAAQVLREPVALTSGAPPPTAPWRSLPPQTAPPLTT